jgi:MFS superfamily sulfate permease-like transporter
MLGPPPRGLPGLAVPSISTGDIVPILLRGFAIALVSFADTSVLSRTYAARIGDPIVGAEPVTSIDVNSADTLDELDHSLAKAGIMLGIAEMKDPVNDKLRRF